MKTALLLLFFFAATASYAQYYYKDIVGVKESSGLLKTYQNARVSSVMVNSFDADNTRNEDLAVTQTFSKAHARLQTITRNGNSSASVLTTYADSAGRVIKTIDSSANLASTTDYSYDADGRLQSIVSSSTDTSKRLNETEAHLWQWAGGQAVRLLRIVNNIDTTIVEFRTDGGNVVEEWSTRRGVKSEPVYYYYNAQNRLTDIVRYNKKAGRLLPEYMFEYSADGRVIQKITVPANSSAYLIWRYQYNGAGLKTKEAIYDRYKTLNGTIEYVYTMDN